MQTEQQNYGVAEGPELAESPGTDVGTRDEKTWSVLAHLSTFLNLVTGFLGPVASLVIWLLYRERSEKVAFQALQSAIYQGAWLVILAAGWAVTFALMAVLIGFLLVPGMALISIIPFAHSIYAAYKVSQGEDYRYPIIADFIENR